mmetsp:Transcript_14400/g.39313  ORF Transcript_14400/g.39313 Transcript_14400/m.39313 type:complete len:81 (-) Transcript_14400:1027-1269(-)
MKVACSDSVRTHVSHLRGSSSDSSNQPTTMTLTHRGSDAVTHEMATIRGARVALHHAKSSRGAPVVLCVAVSRHGCGVSS